MTPVGDDGKFEWAIPLLHMATCLDISIPPLNLSNLRVYRCHVYVHIPVQTQTASDKMGVCASIGYLVGYVASNIWSIWFPAQQ